MPPTRRARRIHLAMICALLNDFQSIKAVIAEGLDTKHRILHSSFSLEIFLM